MSNTELPHHNTRSLQPQPQNGHTTIPIPVTLALDVTYQRGAAIYLSIGCPPLETISNLRITAFNLYYGAPCVATFYWYGLRTVHSCTVTDSITSPFINFQPLCPTPRNTFLPQRMVSIDIGMDNMSRAAGRALGGGILDDGGNAKVIVKMRLEGDGDVTWIGERV